MPGAFWRHVWGLGFAALWQPEVMAVTAAAMIGYLLLAGPLSRAQPKADRASPPQRALFLLMLVVMYAAFGSPVDWLADNAFFSVHSIEHLVAALVMPPLFLYGLPRWTVRRAFGWRPLAAVWRALTRPAPALLVWGGVLAIWHLPLLYDWTLVNNAAHLLEHATIFIAGLVFWWPALSPLPEMPRLADLPLVLYFLMGNIVNWPLFYALALYPGTAFYTPYIAVYRAWRLASPTAFAFSDQRTGGMLMMGGMLVVLGGSIVAAFFRWRYADEESRADDDGDADHGQVPQRPRDDPSPHGSRG